MSEITGSPKSKSAADNDKQAIIDDHINWRHQDKEYNESYKKWRKQKKDTTGFYYVDKPNELTYQDGVGFIRDYPEAAETNALSQVNHYVGISVILIVILDLLSSYALPLILNRLGADITLDISAGRLYGNPWIIIAIMLGISVSKRIYPVLTCFKTLQFPLKLMYPVKISNKPLFRIAVPAILLFAGLSSFSLYFFSTFLKIIKIDTFKNMYIPEEISARVVYLIAVIIICPLLSEVGTRCLLTQLLRQFGDGFAIIMTSLITAMLTYNIASFFYVFATSVVLGYFMLRTGSIITSIIMRITITLYGVIIYALMMIPDKNIAAIAVPCFMLMCIFIGMISITGFIKNHSDKIGMPISTRYLSFNEKIIVCLTSKSVIIAVAMIFIVTIFNIKFRI